MNIPEYKADFINNRSCDDHMFTLRRILEEQWRKEKQTFVISLDLEKKMVMALKELNIPCLLINRINSGKDERGDLLKVVWSIDPQKKIKPGKLNKVVLFFFAFLQSCCM